MQIPEKDILLFGGYSDESYLYNVVTFVLQKHSDMERVAAFCFPSIGGTIFNSKLYIFDQDQHIHTYSLTDQNWSILKKDQWMLDLH